MYPCLLVGLSACLKCSRHPQVLIAPDDAFILIVLQNGEEGKEEKGRAEL
jgi:hypothetical protein